MPQKSRKSPYATGPRVPIISQDGRWGHTRRTRIVRPITSPRESTPASSFDCWSPAFRLRIRCCRRAPSPGLSCFRGRLKPVLQRLNECQMAFTCLEGPPSPASSDESEAYFIPTPRHDASANCAVCVI